MSSFAVECALAAVPDRLGSGRWVFFFVTSEDERGTLATGERKVALSQVKAFANWRECALAVAPIRELLESRLEPASLDADLAAVGFAPDGFIGAMHQVEDVVDKFNKLRRRGKLPSSPTSPLPPDIAKRIDPAVVLRPAEIEHDVRRRWQSIQAAYPLSTSDAPIFLTLFAEFAKEARRDVSDRLIGDVAFKASSAVCDVLLDKPLERWRQRSSAEQLGDVVEIVEAMPTPSFCQQAVTRLSRDARLRFTAELNALGYETEICVDIFEFGPRVVATACRAARAKVTRPAQAAEKEAARALALGFKEIAAASPRCARAQDFYARVNRLFTPGLNISVERALR